MTFLQIFHMSLHNLIFCKSKIYHVFNSLYVDYHNLNVRCIKTNFVTMVSASMEVKLHLYEHGHQVELQALENVVQTPPYGPFDHENLLWAIVIQRTRMQ